MSKVKTFWDWFGDNQSKYLFLGEVTPEERDRLVQDLQDELTKYCDHLFFEIGGDSEDDRGELVISAAGNPDFFSEVEELVAAAPQMKDWDVTAFKQPQGSDFKTEFEGITFDPEKTITIPLENEEFPEAVGIAVCFEDFSEEDEDLFMSGTFLMLDALLGEKATATDIDYIEVGPVPEDVEDIEYIHLSDIAEHVVHIKTRD